MRMWTWTKLSWDKIPYHLQRLKYMVLDIHEEHCHGALDKVSKSRKNVERCNRLLWYFLSHNLRTYWPFYWIASSGEFVQSKKITLGLVSASKSTPQRLNRGCQLNIGGLSQQGSQIKFQTLRNIFQGNWRGKMIQSKENRTLRTVDIPRRGRAAQE